MSAVQTANDVRARFANMYIPSDFMQCEQAWLDSLALHRPLPLADAVHYHIMSKGVPPVRKSDIDFSNIK